MNKRYVVRGFINSTERVVCNCFNDEADAKEYAISLHFDGCCNIEVLDQHDNTVIEGWWS